jgi:membrane-bound ClpP family serine protease
MFEKQDDHFEALIAVFLILISPVLWIILGQGSLSINANSNVEWVLLTTFAIMAYIVFLAFGKMDIKKKKIRKTKNKKA